MKTISTFANRTDYMFWILLKKKYYKLKLQFILCALKNIVSCNLRIDGSEVFTFMHWYLRKKMRKSIYENSREGHWLRIRSAMRHVPEKISRL